MARKPRLFAPGILYHVIVRGNQRQRTFLSPANYQTYLEKLTQYRRQHEVTIFAYCLMPNHVHLLLECGKTPLGKFMQGLQQSYTQYYNRKYKKVGHLFQGRYKAILCQKDAYLLELIRYIHLNPYDPNSPSDRRSIATPATPPTGWAKPQRSLTPAPY
jgi:putative transposase